LRLPYTEVLELFTDLPKLYGEKLGDTAMTAPSRRRCLFLCSRRCRGKSRSAKAKRHPKVAFAQGRSESGVVGASEGWPPPLLSINDLGRSWNQTLTIRGCKDLPLRP